VGEQNTKTACFIGKVGQNPIKLPQFSLFHAKSCDHAMGCSIKSHLFYAVIASEASAKQQDAVNPHPLYNA